MQIFLFSDLKVVSREKDESKIMSLGPYALCLSYILAKTNQTEKRNLICVYRGMTMEKS